MKNGKTSCLALNRRSSILESVMVCWLGCLLGCVGEQRATVPPRDDEARQFTDSAPYGSATEIARHFGYAVPLPDYDLKVERFRLVVPEGYSTNAAWGLLVWISPENEAQVPKQLTAELASHRLLLVSAYKSGNDRHPLDRFRLALDATCNMCRKYRVARTRIYVGGFSGGSRIASMLGVAYGDLFTGTLCVCGVNFYRALRSPEGEEYPATYAPDPGAWAQARQVGRFVFVTGETDPNRRGTKCLAENGFKRDGFKSVRYVEAPGMGHAMPDVEVLRSALDYLDANTKSE
jgi:predicted esterase